MLGGNPANSANTASPALLVTDIVSLDEAGDLAQVLYSDETTAWVTLSLVRHDFPFLLQTYRHRIEINKIARKRRRVRCRVDLPKRKFCKSSGPRKAAKDTSLAAEAVNYTFVEGLNAVEPDIVEPDSAKLVAEADSDASDELARISLCGRPVKNVVEVKELEAEGKIESNMDKVVQFIPTEEEIAESTNPVEEQVMTYINPVEEQVIASIIPVEEQVMASINPVDEKIVGSINPVEEQVIGYSSPVIEGPTGSAYPVDTEVVRSVNPDTILDNMPEPLPETSTFSAIEHERILCENGVTSLAPPASQMEDDQENQSNVPQKYGRECQKVDSIVTAAEDRVILEDKSEEDDKNRTEGESKSERKNYHCWICGKPYHSVLNCSSKDNLDVLAVANPQTDAERKILSRLTSLAGSKFLSDIES